MIPSQMLPLPRSCLSKALQQFYNNLPQGVEFEYCFTEGYVATT